MEQEVRSKRRRLLSVLILIGIFIVAALYLYVGRSSGIPPQVPMNTSTGNSATSSQVNEDRSLPAILPNSGKITWTSVVDLIKRCQVVEIENLTSGTYAKLKTQKMLQVTGAPRLVDMVNVAQSVSSTCGFTPGVSIE